MMRTPRNMGDSLCTDLNRSWRSQGKWRATVLRHGERSVGKFVKFRAVWRAASAALPADFPAKGVSDIARAYRGGPRPRSLARRRGDFLSSGSADARARADEK